MTSNYLEMAREGARLTTNEGKLPVVKVALLGDNSSQQLVKILKASLHHRGLFAEIYEGEYDTIATDILNPASALFAFEPQYVVLNLCSQGYRQRFYNTAADQKPGLPAAYINEVRSWISVLARKGWQVIVSLLALPLERMFGNYSTCNCTSLHSSILEVNRLLSQHATGDPGYLLNDVNYLSAAIGLENWYDERLWTHCKYLCAPKHFPALANNIADIIKTTRGKVAKCIVLDLDNTLWGGVIGDDGMDGIEIGDMGTGEAHERFQRYLLQLKERGIILAVCSKNDEQNAMQPFREHPSMVLKLEDIAVFVANWEAKSANIEYIAKVLNLGLDSLVFVDDSPFERNEVRHALPGLIVPEMPEDPSLFASFLEAQGLFETTSFSEDDRRRAQMYKEEAERSKVALKAANIDEYLQSLEMVMTCNLLDSMHVPRVAQLIQRSNQFNLRTQRISEPQCREFMADPDRHPSFYFKLRDRFGDYGLICAVCTRVESGTMQIVEYVMSCRVLNRGVEQFTIDHLVNFCRARGISKITGEYIPTKKNKLVSGLYRQFGFNAVSESEEKSLWELNVNDFVPARFYIKKEA